MAVKQSALTVFAKLKKGQTDAARDALIQIRPKLADDPNLGFHVSPNTHFARFAVVRDKRDEASDEPGRLLFTSNYDGSATAYLPELVATCGAELDKVFLHCVGYKAGMALNAQEFAGYIRPLSLKPSLFFVSLPGLTVRAIHDADQVGVAMEELLDHSDPEVFRTIQRAAGVLPASHPSRLLQGKKKIFDSLFRFLERLAGIESSGKNPNTTHVSNPVTSLEDRHIQNALTVFATVKDSLLARTLLRVIFFGGRIWYRFVVPWGSLEGVTSIHFARWHLCDGGRSVIFESNFDGSWESYIDQFVDVTGPGLNRIWGNCEGFPRLGTRDLASFKACLRTYQQSEIIFYSAYPELTVKNIIANDTLDKAIQAFMRTPDIDRVFAGSYEIND